MKFKTQKKGFTLIEALVASTILIAGVTAPIYVASVSLFHAADAGDQISAYYFAQEGVEFVRYVRDTNIINNRNWMTNLDRCKGPSGNPCDIDEPAISISSSNEIKACPPSGCRIYSRGDGLFGGNDGVATATLFKRSIRVDEDTGAGVDEKEAVVNVTIEWTRRGKTHTYTLNETMFNWSSP